MTKANENQPSRSHQQNLAALSANFHTHPRYNEFYQRFRDQISGFTGIYDVVIDMAAVMNAWEDAHPDAYDEGCEWIQLCDHFTDKLIEQSLDDGEIFSARGAFAWAVEWQEVKLAPRRKTAHTASRQPKQPAPATRQR